MIVYLIIELPLGDEAPIVKAYKTEQLAIDSATKEYAESLEGFELDEGASYVTKFETDIGLHGVHYCTMSESVYYLVERELIEPPPLKAKPRWHVLHDVCGDWKNTWTVEDSAGSRPLTFATRKEAQAELDGIFSEQRSSIKRGDIGKDEGHNRSEYTIERVKA